MKKASKTIILLVIGFSALFLIISFISNQGTTTTSQNNYSEPKVLTHINDKENKENYTFINGWQSDLIDDEKVIVVEFGALKDDKNQGMALVKELDKNGKKILSEQRYLTPDKHGPIKLQSFNAYILTVSAKDNFKWNFNIFDGFHDVQQ